MISPALSASAVTPLQCAALTQVTLEDLDLGTYDDCDLTSKSLIVEGYEPFVIPAAGRSRTAFITVVDGAPEINDLSVYHSAAGEVAVTENPDSVLMLPTFHGSTAARVAFDSDEPTPVETLEPAQASASSPKCTNNAYAFTRAKWNKKYEWYYNVPGGPTGFSNGQGFIQNAFAAVTHGYYACGANQENGSSSEYQTTTVRNPKLTDGFNVVGFDYLANSSVAAVTFVDTAQNNPKKIVEADIIFNRNKTWYRSADLDGCSGTKYDLQSIATHEALHAFGLNHVPNGSGQSLDKNVSYCDTSLRRLGRGDASGMLLKYPNN